MSNILIVGVGGQGSLLASRILGAFYAKRGLDVKLSEVHGMSQRGGSVVTYVRAAERVDSPIISIHGATAHPLQPAGGREGVEVAPDRHLRDAVPLGELRQADPPVGLDPASDVIFASRAHTAIEPEGTRRVTPAPAARVSCGRTSHGLERL